MEEFCSQLTSDTRRPTFFSRTVAAGRHRACILREYPDRNGYPPVLSKARAAPD